MKLNALLLSLVVISGCSTAIQKESFTLANGQVVDYITGKVAGDGQEANFRDAFVDGKPVLSNYGSGASLTGQILTGTGAAALIAGGMVGSSAVLRPTRINESTSNSLDGGNATGGSASQGQGQGQLQGQSATAVSVSEASSRSRSHNSNSNINTNSTPGGPSCQGNCGGHGDDDD